LKKFYHHAKFDLKSLNDRQWWQKWILYLKFSGFKVWTLKWLVASHMLRPTWWEYASVLRRG
jgi:hypothetical protein